MKSSLFALLLTTAFLSGCFVTASGARYAPGKQGTVTISDLNDALETTAWVSSIYYQQSAGRGDIFLRAAIDKATKNTQFYQFYVSTSSSDWRYWETLSFNFDGDLRSLRNATRISSDPNCSQYGCNPNENYGFVVSKEELNKMALHQGAIPMRVKSASGEQDLFITGKEIRAVLTKTSEIIAALL